MEGIIAQRVTPLLKCVVLFLFIFTAKVLTSRPHESQDGKNSIQHLKPSHFVRTFTKYHHRRTIQWNQEDWPSDEHPKVIQKRNAEVAESDSYDNYQENWDDHQIVKRNPDIPNSNEFISSGKGSYPLSLSQSLRDNIGVEKTAISGGNNGAKNGLSNDVKKYKVKAAHVPTDPPSTTTGPTITCLYKTNSVAMSVTPSYDDDSNAQLMVENENFDTGPISMTTLPSGETVQVEHCTDARAYCYTLWHQDNDGNVTIFGQGCWRSSRAAGRGGCDRCTRVTPRLPATNFCCCTMSYCNTHFSYLEEELVPLKAESPREGWSRRAGWGGALSGALALLAVLAAAVALARLYCRRTTPPSDTEKADVMGSGPDALATGLLCVDNLTLIEHIGQGKFGSVWRGTLGSTSVAVKLYSNESAWQKEAAIYALPHLAHPNLLRYYGSDSRTSPLGARSQLVVLELCGGSLRARLQAAPLSWPQYARLAHGLAAALAHLHSHSGSKPCVVHRDVNSNNVLIVNGDARLADLGLAQVLPPRSQPSQPSRIAEAGTLRYLAPEALEGALDLSEARAALCAVDVFALGLVLWELLWRCSGAHAGGTPPYMLPYQHHGIPNNPTLPVMQNLVSRNKARPPLPKPPVAEWRALKIAADTCDECWDHDAEARLTAVCVEERMSELKQLLQPTRPLVHDNNLHPHPPDASVSPPEPDKNSNCTAQQCDVTTPLLYPQPHIGRNACIERNTHTHTASTVELIHKSLKDITAPQDAPRVPNFEENCLSVARVNHHRPIIHDYENSDRLNDIRSYQRPLDYIPNDVSTHDAERRPKQTNLLQDVKIEKPKWGIKRFFEKKLGKSSKLETEVKLIPEHSNGVVQNGRTKTSIVNGKCESRPSNLVLDHEKYNFEIPCTLSPPNRTLSPTMLMESNLNRENRVFGFKELPARDEENKPQNQIFAVIVPKAKPPDLTNLIEMRNKGRGSSESVKNSIRTSMSSQSIFKSGHSESEDSTTKKRLSCDNRIITDNSGRSSRASINLELQYLDNNPDNFTNDSPFDLNSDCSSSEDEHLMLLSENGGSKITMQTIKPENLNDKKKYQNEVLKESSHKTELGFNFQNKYKNFDNEFSDPNDKENLVNGYSGDNPVYIAALNGEIDTTDLKFQQELNGDRSPKSPKPCLKSLSIKRQHSLEQVSEIFSSSSDLNLQNPAGRVKTPGDLPVAIRKARRDRALQKGRANECNRLSLYDDRMMFGNSL
ncbi:uncharacterized protein LOC126378339 [Pectinophora gossypiella]|uniref:uncharacterized protein LOC126378339 n=1 Tax=Pectinophora gossypiella TaxID=13191 RepID=UPI00214E518C|nr:uncharacterized protein LOC126378339 [Pectinophora gossypiella]